MKKSAQQHKIDGTFRADRHSEVITHKYLSVVPDPPPVFKENMELINLYNHYAGILLEKNMLFEEDLPILQSFCSAVYVRDQSLKELLTNGVIYNHNLDRGNSNPSEHPAWKIHKSASELIMRLSQKLGFNLYDKPKILVPPQKDEVDPIMKALK
jgi:P27 family predicted phage terminase small subunit